MTTPDQAKARLRAYVSHFIDHAQDHVAEIDAQRPALADDAALQQSLERALQDVQLARRSLVAVLEQLGASPAADGRHHHGHSHAHHSHDS